MAVGLVHMYPVSSPGMNGTSLTFGCFAFDASLGVSPNVGPNPMLNIHRLQLLPWTNGQLTIAPPGIYFGGTPPDPGLSQSPPMLTWIPESNPSVTWTSSDHSVATLSDQVLSDTGESQILATFAGTGSTTISATVGSVTANATLTVNSITSPGNFTVTYGVNPAGNPYSFTWQGKRIFNPQL